MKEFIDSKLKAAKNWWISVIIGVLAIVLGILFISSPLSSMLTLALFFAFGFILSGILETLFAITNRKVLNGWGWNLVSSLIDLFLGIVLLSIPGLTIMLMIYLIGFWIMFRSIWAIGSSIEMQKAEIKGWGWLLTAAILGIIFSFIFILSPTFGGTFIVAFAAISFIIYGIFRIFMGFTLKSIKNNLED